MYIHSHSNDHLDELKTGDEYGDGFGYAVPECLESVICVHARMDEKVERDVPSGWSNVLFVGVPGIQKRGNVMIPVKKD